MYLLVALLVVDGVVTTDAAIELASSCCVWVPIGLREVPGLSPEIGTEVGRLEP